LIFLASALPIFLNGDDDSDNRLVKVEIFGIGMKPEKLIDLFNLKIFVLAIVLEM
jgi:hypothetical protein